MKLESFSYVPDSGWSVDSFPPVDSEQTLVVVCGASEFIEQSDPIEELHAAYPNSHLIGCSTSGEIFGTHIIDRSLAVAVLQFEHTGIRGAISPVNEPSESLIAGQSIARLLNDDTLRGVIVFSDGLNVNGTELIKGINSVFSSSVIVTGGLAGDGDRFQKTWVLKDGLPHTGYVSAVGLYGDRVRIGHGSKGGWDIFGPERTITKSEGNVLYELDGRPALELYKKYLGDRASGLPATALLFPLALRRDRDDEKKIVRTILSVDEATQSMTFAGDMPQGYLSQLMRANFDRLIFGAAEAAMLSCKTRHSENPMLSLAISCVGRRLVLGERSEEELEATMEIFPPETAQMGFYSYGEISPYSSGHCDLHNQTMTLTTITED